MRVHRISEAIAAKSIHGFCYAYIVHGTDDNVVLNCNAATFYLVSRDGSRVTHCYPIT